MTSKEAKRRYATRQPKFTTAQLRKAIREEEAAEKREAEANRAKERAEEERERRRIQAHKRKLKREEQQREAKMVRQQQGLPKPSPWVTPDQQTITAYFRKDGGSQSRTEDCNDLCRKLEDQIRQCSRVFGLN